jgi:hypothetical protein
MINTVIVWPQDLTSEHRNPSRAQIDIMNQKAKTIAPGFVAKVGIFIDDTRTLQTTVRTWPSAETAQAWVDYITANHTVESASVNLEPVDTAAFGELIKSWTGDTPDNEVTRIF